MNKLLTLGMTLLLGTLAPGLYSLHEGKTSTCLARFEVPQESADTVLEAFMDQRVHPVLIRNEHNPLARIVVRANAEGAEVNTLFFSLAGANLHIAALPSLGVLGIVYAAGRSVGLIGGARIGATIGKVNDMIRRYLGLGILSQAGVAIGLALIVKHEFGSLGPLTADGVHRGEVLGATVITTITATCIFFEIIGPILTKYALGKAGELNNDGS